MASDNYYVPSDRDMLLGLLDGLMALSDKLFPDERMVIKLIDTRPGESNAAEAMGPTLTRWVPR